MHFFKDILCGLVCACGFLLPSCSSQDGGRVPRQVAFSESEFGDIRTIAGRTIDGFSVMMSVRPYAGVQTNFWGAETSPPIDVLWTLSFCSGSGVIEIPSEYLRDLANILLSAQTKTIESFVAINSRRLSIHRVGDFYHVHLDAGDGVNAYGVDFKIRIDGAGLIGVERKVRYHMDHAGELWG